MNTSPAKKLATTLGVGSLLLGSALIAAPAATAAPPITTAATAPAAPAAEAATGARTALVAAWYRQFLLRDAAQDPGSSYWVVQLRDRPADQVLAEILSSREYVSAQVDEIYLNYLSRTPDPGARYWVDGVLAGSFPLEWVRQNVLASPEYAETAKTQTRDSIGVVRAWYADVLARNVYRPGEITYWQNRLRQTSPLQVLREIWYTAEAVNARVDYHYAIHLGRSADPGELAYWYGQEVTSDQATEVAIASSAEAQAYATANFG